MCTETEKELASQVGEWAAMYSRLRGVLEKVELRLRLLDTSGMTPPQRRWIDRTRMLAADALKGDFE